MQTKSRQTLTAALLAMCCGLVAICESNAAKPTQNNQHAQAKHRAARQAQQHHNNLQQQKAAQAAARCRAAQQQQHHNQLQQQKKRQQQVAQRAAAQKHIVDSTNVVTHAATNAPRGAK